MARRFAIYAAPEADSALGRLANGWLGRDPVSGAALPRPGVAGFTAERCGEITAAPRHYGFHGTLKPPFRLAPGTRAEDLIAALAAFAEARAPIALPPFAVTALGGFVALTCYHACPDLDRLAADRVRDFDRFRAAMDDQERARRRAGGLTPRQDRNLREWGHPYVMEDFRFHMTLTGRLAPEERGRACRALAGLFEAVDLAAIRLDSICLFEQQGAERPFLLSKRLDFKRVPPGGCRTRGSGTRRPGG